MRTRAIVIAVLFLACGCPLKKPAPVAAPVPDRPDSAAGLTARVRARGDGVRRYDAVVEAVLSGAPGGRLFGGIQIEDAADEGLAVRLQAYAITGLPVMEMIARGPRFQLFSPMEQRTYFNFTGAPGAEQADDYPLALFNDVTLPVGLLLEQLGLFWGRGFGATEMAAAPDGYIVYERSGGQLMRETEWDRDLRLIRVKLFSEGDLYGGMECEGYKGTGPAALLPSHITLYQGEMRLELQLSKVRVNEEVKGPPIAFRRPGPGRVLLLSPPLSPPGKLVVEPEPAAGSTVGPASEAVTGSTTAAPEVEELPGSTAAPVDPAAVPTPAEGSSVAPPPAPSPGAPAPILPD